jgi:cation:H+ antiporter
MINGAIALARLTRLPEIIIGATIISLGTTLPEVFVSVTAAWTGNPGLALGNGVGSIICDTGMILGLTCLLARVPVDKYILNRAGFVQLGAATLMVLLSLHAYYISPEAPTLQRWVGILFLILLVGYLYLSFRWSKENTAPNTDDDPVGMDNIFRTVVSLVGGLVGIFIASRILIPSAAEGAIRAGVPQDVVATTLVAFGTSLPELVTAVTAVRKGHPQIMVGNVVGADVLNCLFVVGAATVASPLHVPPNFFILHFPAMLLILYSFRLFIHMNKDGWFKRIQGAWILGIYFGYLLLQYQFNTGT